MTRTATVLAFALLTTGCAATIVVDAPEPAGARAPPLAATPVAVDYVRVSFDGVEGDVEDELLLLVANELRKSGLFANVYEAKVEHEAPPGADRLWLEIAQAEQLEPTGVGMLKAFVSIYSLGLFSFLVPEHYGYDVELAAVFHAADGRERSYRSRASGRAEGSTWADWAQAGNDTRAQVLDRAFALLMDEIARGDPTGP